MAHLHETPTHCKALLERQAHLVLPERELLLALSFCITILAVEIHRSARKHRVSDEAIAHAFQHALARLDFDPDEHPPRYALVGPDPAGNMIELVVIVGDEDRHIVIHAMRARPNFLALLDDIGDEA